MKKIIPIIGALFATMLFAGEPPALCTEKPWLPQCDQGQVGPQGPIGPQGPAGADGKDGQDGKDGMDGADGRDGVDGRNGVDGKDGVNGTDGRDGVDGKDGADGKDGKDFNSKGYETAYREFLEYGKKATKYYEDSAAGAAAIASIDFGSTCKGVTVGGIGIGTSKSFTGRSNAVGVGIKHGLTDTDAVIVKGWVAGSNSHAIGAGLTHRF